VPEVARTISLDSFVPDDQPAKLALIRKAAATLDPVLKGSQGAAPNDTDRVVRPEPSRRRACENSPATPMQKRGCALGWCLQTPRDDLTKLAVPTRPCATRWSDIHRAE